jgi:hypothetical protein
MSTEKQLGCGRPHEDVYTPNKTAAKLYYQRFTGLARRALVCRQGIGRRIPEDYSKCTPTPGKLASVVRGQTIVNRIARGRPCQIRGDSCYELLVSRLLGGRLFARPLVPTGAGHLRAQDNVFEKESGCPM